MGKFSQFKIQLASLADGVHEQDFLIDTAFFKNMEVAEVLTADVAVHLVLTKKNEAYHCVFTLKGEITVPCDRCLDPVVIPVDTEYSLTVKYGEAYSDESDDVLVIPYSDAALNVAYMLKDTVQLCIPIRHVHPLGGCNRGMSAVLSKHGAMDRDDEDGLDPDFDGADADAYDDNE